MKNIYLFLGLFLLYGCPMVASWKAGVPIGIDAGWDGLWVPDTLSLSNAERPYWANFRIKKMNAQTLRIVSAQPDSIHILVSRPYHATPVLLNKDTLLCVQPLNNNPSKLYLYYKIKRRPGGSLSIWELESTLVPDSIQEEDQFVRWYAQVNSQSKIWGTELKYHTKECSDNLPIQGK